MWKKNIPFVTMHCGAAVTGPQFDIGSFIPLWLWCLLFGGLVVATLWAYSSEIAAIWHRIWRFRGTQKREIARHAMQLIKDETRKRHAELILANQIQDPDERLRFLTSLVERYREEDRHDE